MRRQFFAVAVAAPQQQDDRSDRPHRFHSSSAYRDTSSATARAGASRVRLSRGFRLRSQMVDVHEHGNPTEERSFGATFLFPTFFPFRVSSAPFALFPRVILAPVLSRAYSGPATPFNLIHKIKTRTQFWPLMVNVPWSPCGKRVRRMARRLTDLTRSRSCQNRRPAVKTKN
jgi:hypothetical protein